MNFSPPPHSMNLKKLIRFFTAKDLNLPVLVTFTGGMGAQVISAAIYYSMRSAGHTVYADLSYFNQTESIAIAGNLGDCSHWSWQLEPFKLTPTSFELPPPTSDRKNYNVVQDGPQKLELALNALSQTEIQRYFKIPTGVDDVLPSEFADGYLCMHVRRGDYVNVASHLVADGDFSSLARNFSGLVSNAVVISDSPIELDFQNVVSSYFKQVIFLDNTDAFTAHRIMRNARILICSNSQFSLIAAVLNPNALKIIPKQWFGGKNRHIEAALNSHCLFQIME